MGADGIDMIKKLIAGVALAVGMTACGVNGTEIEQYREGETCYVEIHDNRSGDTDRDDKYLVGCTFDTVAP